MYLFSTYKYNYSFINNAVLLEIYKMLKDISILRIPDSARLVSCFETETKIFF